MKNRRRLTRKETLFLCIFYGGMFGITSASLDLKSLGNTLIIIFGIAFPVLIVFAYFYGVKVDEEKH